MQVDYSFLDAGFKTLSCFRGEPCFGRMYAYKIGKYVSYDMRIPYTKDNRKYYREMIQLWGKFLERPAKELKSKNSIIMDMDKHSINFVLSVFGAFRFLTDWPPQVDYYCYLRNKYRKLPIFSALVATQTRM